MRAFTGFLKGINFGGWLSQCDHTKERYDTFITEKDFEEVKSRGYDHVRVPIDYELLVDDEMNVKEGGFAYIDMAIENCRKYGLNMVLDLHRTIGFSFDPGHNKTGGRIPVSNGLSQKISRDLKKRGFKYARHPYPSRRILQQLRGSIKRPGSSL